MATKSVAYALVGFGDELSSYWKAMGDSEAEQWKIAMDEEVQYFHNNETWELCKLSKGGNRLGASGCS